MGNSRVRGFIVASVLVLALAGCSGATGGSAGTGTTAATSAADGSAEPETGAAQDSAGDDADTAEDTGTSAGTGVPTLVSEAPEGSPTIAIGAASMEPATLTIAVGTVVAFTSGDGSFHGLLVNELSSVTVAENLPEYYQFTEAGTYSVADELTAGTATITVE